MKKKQRKSQKRPAQELARANGVNGGEGGIRTRGRGLNPFNSLANCRSDSTSGGGPEGCGDGPEALGRLLAHIAAELAEIAPDLATVVDAWPTLPGPIKAAILAMIESAKGGE